MRLEYTLLNSEGGHLPGMCSCSGNTEKSQFLRDRKAPCGDAAGAARNPRDCAAQTLLMRQAYFDVPKTRCTAVRQLNAQTSQLRNWFAEIDLRVGVVVGLFADPAGNCMGLVEMQG